MNLDQNNILSTIAAGQRGLATRSQLSAAGVSDRQIDRLLANGRAHSLGRGVIQLAGLPGDPLRPLAAAVLATGGAASHRSAASNLTVIEWRPQHPELSVVYGRSARRPVIIHRSIDLARSDIQIVNGIATTSAVRTLIDLGAVVKPWIVESALEVALRKQLVTLDDVIARFLQIARRGRRGCGVIRPILEEREAALAVADSPLEVLLYRALRERGAPLPERQFEVRIGVNRFFLDMAYAVQRLFIEGDGFGVHSSARAFEDDRARQNLLVLAGWTPLRYTWKQIRYTPDDVVTEIVTAYRQRSTG